MEKGALVEVWAGREKGAVVEVWVGREKGAVVEVASGKGAAVVGREKDTGLHIDVLLVGKDVAKEIRAAGSAGLLLPASSKLEGEGEGEGEGLLLPASSELEGEGEGAGLLVMAAAGDCRTVKVLWDTT